MYAGSIPARASTSQTRECAALAQLVEHIIRNDGVTCSSHVSGTTFFPFYFNMSRILERAWIIATIPPLVVLDFWNRVPGSVSDTASLRKSPSGSLTPENRATSCRWICRGNGLRKTRETRAAQTISEAVALHEEVVARSARPGAGLRLLRR